MHYAKPSVLLAFALATVLAAATPIRAEFFLGGRYTAEGIFSDHRVASLARAACDGNVVNMKREIGNGANPNLIGAFHYSPLLWAEFCSNAIGVKALLEAGANPNYELPPQNNRDLPRGGITPVFVAAGAKDPEILRLLLAHGGNPNAVETSGSTTALSHALEIGVGGHGWANYYALLDAGADINLVHGNKTIADHAVVMNQFDKVVELLQRGYSGDLDRLANLTDSAVQYSGDPQIAWRQKVIENLKAKGVQFPVIPDYFKTHSGRASLEEDGTLLIQWWGGHRGQHTVEPSEQKLSPSDPAYARIMKRVGGLKRFESKDIPRSTEDPDPGPR